MTIDGINSTNASYLEQLLATTQTNTEDTSEVKKGGFPPPPPPMDSTNMSKISSLLSKLETLQSEDPDKFNEIVSNIADELEAAAAEEDSEFSSKMLSDLASKFRSAAESGDLSSLMPPEPPPPPPSGQATQNGTAQYAEENTDEITKLLSGQQSMEDLRASLNSTLTTILNNALNLL